MKWAAEEKGEHPGTDTAGFVAALAAEKMPDLNQTIAHDVVVATAAVKKPITKTVIIFAPLMLE